MKVKKKSKALKKSSSKTKMLAKNKGRRKISTKGSAKKSKKVLVKPIVKPAIKSKTSDLAHSPGHKKLNKTDQFTDPRGQKDHLQQSAINNLSNADIIRKHNSRHRRIISGAAVGKTGRITIKD